VKGLRIGIERAHHQGVPGEDPGVVDCLDRAAKELETAGASVKEVVFPHFEEAAAVALVTTAGEALAYHRNDLRERWLDYGLTTRAFLVQGAFYNSADYVNADRVRTLVRHEAAALFHECDVLITPTVGFVAPRFEEDFMPRLMPLLFTMAWNAVGYPAASIPVGFVNGLPVGMQIIGRPFDEATILRVADAYQRLTDWHLRENSQLAALLGT
jgi:aspartyl-tRNA(Asn)/glutamyl-tRNA(Gln) amidotransferase subunit A